MKNLLILLCLLFICISMSAQNKVVRSPQTTTNKVTRTNTTSQAVKKDYVKFDNSGSKLVAFRRTCEDGSYMEVEGTHYKNNEYYYRPVTICDSKGNKYTGTFRIHPTHNFDNHRSLEDCYREKSYDNFINVFFNCVTSYFGNEDECIIEMKTKPIKYYVGQKHIIAAEEKDGEGYVKYFCNHCFDKSEYNGEKNYPTDLNNIQMGGIIERKTVYSNGTIIAKYWDGNIFEAKIEFGNGDKYVGTIDLSGMSIDSDSFKSGTEMPQFKYINGALKLKNGTIRVYVSGEIDELESQKPKYKNYF